MSTSDSDDPSITNDPSINSGQGFGEKCGVAAVWTKSSFAPQLVRRASIALQHRGQESAGIAIFSKPNGLKTRFNPFLRKGLIKVHTGMGLVSRVLSDELINSLGPAHIAIAHNRYSTTGGSSLINAHPIHSKYKRYKAAIAHNGNIPDTTWLKQNVRSHPQANSDTALMAALLAEQRPKFKSWEETFIHVLPNIKGAFSLAILTEDESLYGIRDPWGIRPLSLGRLEDGWIIASETTALDAVGASFVRHIKNGEILKISKDGQISSFFFGDPKRQQLCLLEHIYFSRPDSFMNGKRIKTLRENSGRALARRIKKKGIKPDVVVPIFNSGYFAARGAADELKVPLVDAVITSSYFGRTFINPGQELRQKAVAGKHSVIPDEIFGKKVVFVDDSAIRFNTSAILSQSLKNAGSKAVYAAFASPPVINQCDMGIDMRAKSELPASKYEHESIEKIEKKMAQLIKVNDLIYLPLDETCSAMQGEIKDFYTYPFGGKHPVRDKQEVFPKRKRETLEKVSVILLGTDEGLKTLVEDVVILDTAKSEEELVKETEKLLPDLVFISDPKINLNAATLEKLKKLDITVLKFISALINNDLSKTVRTSRGEVPLILENGVKRAFQEKLPVWGVSVIQVLPEYPNKLGPVILKEEVKINGNFKEYKKRIEEARERVIKTALKRVVYVLLNNIKTSGGEFPW